MRTNLKVPFAEKDAAKKLGARWDAARKIWYVESVGDLAPFAKWSPTPHESSGGSEPAPKSAPGRNQQAIGKALVGADFIEQSRLCACLPWEVCDKCQASALNNLSPQPAGAA